MNDFFRTLSTTEKHPIPSIGTTRKVIVSLDPDNGDVVLRFKKFKPRASQDPFNADTGMFTAADGAKYFPVAVDETKDNAAAAAFVREFEKLNEPRVVLGNGYFEFFNGFNRVDEWNSHTFGIVALNYEALKHGANYLSRTAMKLGMMHHSSRGAP